MLFFIIYDFVRPCLLRLWFEPVVSHSYYSLRRQHFIKSLIWSDLIALTVTKNLNLYVSKWFINKQKSRKINVYDLNSSKWFINIYRWSGSNRHVLNGHGILSPACLPIPPHRLNKNPTKKSSQWKK